MNSPIHYRINGAYDFNQDGYMDSIRFTAYRDDAGKLVNVNSYGIDLGYTPSEDPAVNQQQIDRLSQEPLPDWVGKPVFSEIIETKETQGLPAGQCLQFYADMDGDQVLDLLIYRFDGADPVRLSSLTTDLEDPWHVQKALNGVVGPAEHMSVLLSNAQEAQAYQAYETTSQDPNGHHTQVHRTIVFDQALSPDQG